MAAFRVSIPVRVQISSSTGSKETSVRTTKSTTVGFILRSVAFWLPEQGKGYGLVLPDGQQLRNMGTKLSVYKLQPYDIIQVKRFFPGIISVQVGSTQQSFQVSMDSTVREITQQICKETGICDAENYSLVLIEGGGGFCEVGNGPAEGKWLGPDVTLDQLGVDNLSKLQLRKLPQSRHGEKSELILDQVTSVTVGANCERRLVEKKRLPAMPSSIPRRGSTPSPTALQAIPGDSESKTESQRAVSSDNLDDLSFEGLEAYLAESYHEIAQIGEKQPETDSAADKSSLHGQSCGTQWNGVDETLSWDIVDGEMQSGCGEIEMSVDDFQMNQVEILLNGQPNSPSDDDGYLGSDVVVPNVCDTDETGRPVVKPQAASTPLKFKCRHSSHEEGGASEVSESSYKVDAKNDADAGSFPEALRSSTLTPQEALRSLWPVSPPDLEEGYSQPVCQPPSSFTTQLENQLNAVATMKSHPPKGDAAVEEEKRRYYHTYSAGMHRGSHVHEAPGQTVEVELHSNPSTTLQRYLVPLKDTWPRRQKDAMEAAYNDSGIGCSPSVIHSSRKSSRSLDLADGDMSSRSAFHPSSHRGDKCDPDSPTPTSPSIPRNDAIDTSCCTHGNDYILAHRRLPLGDHPAHKGAGDKCEYQRSCCFQGRLTVSNVLPNGDLLVEEVFTSLRVREPLRMDPMSPSPPGPLVEEGQALDGNREVEEEDCFLQFGGRASDTYDHLVPLKGQQDDSAGFTSHVARIPALDSSVASSRDSVLNYTAVDGALVYPMDQKKAHFPISKSSNGKQTEVMLSQGDDEVFGGPSPIQPGKDFPFNVHLSDIKSPPWSRLGASSSSQPYYPSTDTLLTERDFPSRESVLEESEELAIGDSSKKHLQRKGNSASAIVQQGMATSGKTLQRSISSPEVRVGSGEEDHRSITSADLTTWRLDYYKMDYPDVISKYTVIYVIVMDQDIRPFLVNPKKNVRDIIREICCTFRMDNPSRWHFCMPRGLQVILSKVTSAATRQTMLSVGSVGGGISKKTFFHLSTDIISKEDILDGGRPLIDQYPFAAKPYVIHMRKHETKYYGSLDALDECDIGCEWPDGEVEAKARCFHQTWCSIAQSHCPVEKHIAAEIAALLLQAHFGNYSKSNRRFSEVLPLFLPEMYRTKRNVLKQARKIYKRLKGITAKHAMQSVITRFREQPGHDGIFFSVKAVPDRRSKMKASKLKSGIFGMCYGEVIYLDPKTAKVIFRRSYSEIKSVEASKRHFKIDFGAHVSDPFAASSPVALEVMNILKLFIQMHPIPAELQPHYQACSISQASLPLQNNPEVEVIQI